MDPLIKRRRGLTALVVLDVVKALAHSAYREAVSWFEQALTALHPLPDTRQKIERGIDLRLDIRQSLFPLGELATALRYLREAEELARTLDDPRRLGWVSAYLCGHRVHTGGHATEVRTLAQRVEAIAERLGDVPLQSADRERFGLVVSPAVMSRATLARTLAEHGVFDETLKSGSLSGPVGRAQSHFS